MNRGISHGGATRQISTDFSITSLEQLHHFRLCDEKEIHCAKQIIEPTLNQLINFFALEVPAVMAARVLSICRYSAERVGQVVRHHLA